jgi:hypothetical protein
MQEVANTMWAYATRSREPGEGMMRELEGLTEEVACMFNTQVMANTMWVDVTMGREPSLPGLG